MKIGIILDSTKVSWYLNDLVEWIKKDPSLNLEVLLIQNIKSKKKSLFNESFPKLLDRIFFKIESSTEFDVDESFSIEISKFSSKIENSSIAALLSSGVGKFS